MTALATIAETQINLPGATDSAWRLLVLLGMAWLIGLLLQDAIAGAGLRSTQLLRAAVIVALVGRAGAMIQNFDQPITIWGTPFTTAALVLAYLSVRAYRTPAEDRIREGTGVGGKQSLKTRRH